MNYEDDPKEDHITSSLLFSTPPQGMKDVDPYPKGHIATTYFTLWNYFAFKEED